MMFYILTLEISVLFEFSLFGFNEFKCWTGDHVCRLSELLLPRRGLWRITALVGGLVLVWLGSFILRFGGRLVGVRGRLNFV